MKTFEVTAFAAVSFRVEAETADEATEGVRYALGDFSIVADVGSGISQAGGTIEEITYVEEIK